MFHRSFAAFLAYALFVYIFISSVVFILFILFLYVSSSADLFLSLYKSPLVKSVVCGNLILAFGRVLSRVVDDFLVLPWLLL